MVKSDNYIHISGWMLSKLGLSGNSLLIYAIIYGFSQTEGHYFNGSLNYLSEWTNSTKQGVIKNLKELVDLGFIIKQEASPTNIYYVNRSIIDEVLSEVNIVNDTVNSVNQVVNKVKQNSEQSLPNNINNNINNKYIKEKELTNNIEEVINYFNKVCNTKFRSNSKATRQLIRKHLNEGFSIADFKTVVDSKFKEWGINPKPFTNGMMSNEYLRPTTLFGDKFETYLYEASVRESSESAFNSVSVDIDPERSNLVF